MFSVSGEKGKTKSPATSLGQQKNYNGIDLIKFLCSLLIFAIHIDLFSEGTSAFGDSANFWSSQYLCRIAVPFFFVSSGFFLFKKMPLYDLNTDIIKNYCFKILRLLGIWCVLLVLGGIDHLWYLGASVIAIILLSLFLHFGIKFRYICITACLLYIIGLLGDSYFGIIEPLGKISIFKYIFKAYNFVFSTTRNGVFMGFIFMLMGAAFSRCKINIKPLISFLGFIASMFLLFVEVFLLESGGIPRNYNMYICLIPAVFFLFSFAYTLRLKDRPIYKHLRTIGVLVYFSHILFGELVFKALQGVSSVLGFNPVPFHFLFTLAATLIFAIFINWLSSKEKFKWLCWLWS